MRILVVEDEPALRRLICASASDAGFGSDEAECLDDATALVAGFCYDAIVLDLGLADGDGLDLIPVIRREGAGTPVLILTARDSVSDRVAGLDAGADDYLVKPFASEELLARIRALLRRPGAVLGRVLTAGNVTLDTVSRSATVGEQLLALTRHEVTVLEYLLRRQGRLVPKDILFDKVYGSDTSPETNTIPVHVHHVRKQLTEHGANIEIETHRGLGYLLSAPRGAPC
jgi:DNA-binding response OmpR family regulator